MVRVSFHSKRGHRARAPRSPEEPAVLRWKSVAFLCEQAAAKPGDAMGQIVAASPTLWRSLFCP
eukprot:CAMPEP_0115316462 /NCGR_PEP_ID=MMETSP0270-20121206/78138_1 /TAXON_ID=71861 /ORGANISM="Scrippsiella trochoidea, Strain CCMP3099" /LENGTH=63 /DNA_ID=CAMNT_0002735875 /DNA_START=112 /DNA_END=300 /DNA_ORIENTATION=+